MKRKGQKTTTASIASLYVPREYGTHSAASKRRDSKKQARPRRGARTEEEIFSYDASDLQHPRRRIAQDDSILQDRRQQRQQQRVQDEIFIENSPPQHVSPPPSPAPQLRPVAVYPVLHRFNLRDRVRMLDARAKNLEERKFAMESQFINNVKSKAPQFTDVIAAFGDNEFYCYYNKLKRQHEQQQAHTRLFDLGNNAYCMPIWDYDKQILNYKKYCHCYRSPGTNEWVCDCPMWGDAWRCTHTLIATMESEPRQFNTPNIAGKKGAWQIVNEYVTYLGSFQKRMFLFCIL